MPFKYELPAGSVLSVATANRVVVRQVENSAITAYVDADRPASFGPYLADRSFIVDGNATVSIADPSGTRSSLGERIDPMPLPTEIAFSDFANGVYRLNGSTAAVGDLWTANETDWGTFDPSVGIVSGQGLVANDAGNDDPTATTALFNALWPNGFVCVALTLMSSTDARILFDVYTPTTFAEEYKVTLQSNNVVADYGPSNDGVPGVCADPGVGVNLRTVFRVLPTRISVAQCNGISSVYVREGATPNLGQFSVAMYNSAKLKSLQFFAPTVPFYSLMV